MVTENGVGSPFLCRASRKTASFVDNVFAMPSHTPEALLKDRSWLITSLRSKISLWELKRNTLVVGSGVEPFFAAPLQSKESSTTISHSQTGQSKRERRTHCSSNPQLARKIGSECSECCNSIPFGEKLEGRKPKNQRSFAWELP